MQSSNRERPSPPLSPLINRNTFSQVTGAMVRSSWWVGRMEDFWQLTCHGWVGESNSREYPWRAAACCMFSLLIWVGASEQWVTDLSCVKELILRRLSASREGSPCLRASTGKTSCYPCLEEHSVEVDFCLLVYLPGTPQLDPFFSWYGAWRALLWAGSTPAMLQEKTGDL